MDIEKEIKAYRLVEFGKIFTDAIRFECVLDQRNDGEYLRNQFLTMKDPSGFVSELVVWLASNLVNRGVVSFNFTLDTRKLYNEYQNLQVYDLRYLIKYLNKANINILLSNGNESRSSVINEQNLNVLEKTIELTDEERYIKFSIMLDATIGHIKELYDLILPADSKPEFKVYIKF